MIEKLFAKKAKQGKELDPMEKEAKMHVLQELHKDLADHMGDQLRGLKKVTVGADSKEGLAEGLDKAKEILHKMPEAPEADENADEEMPEADERDPEAHDEFDNEEAEEEAAFPERKAFDANAAEEPEHEMAHLSDDELDQHIAKLQAAKDARKK